MHLSFFSGIDIDVFREAQVWYENFVFANMAPLTRSRSASVIGLVLLRRRREHGRLILLQGTSALLAQIWKRVERCLHNCIHLAVLMEA